MASLPPANVLLLQDDIAEKNEPVAPEEPSKNPRNDGPHAPRQAREKPDEVTVPPCCRVSFGHPKDLSPFCQVHLPKGWKFQGKASRSSSYGESSGPAVPNGTSRSKQMALRCIESWAWQWWDTLPPITQASLRGHKDVDADAERPAKRPRA